MATAQEARIKLHSLETTYLILLVPAVSTVTFYKGACPLAYIKKRVAQLVIANPWLLSRLVSKAKGDIDLVFNEAPEKLIDQYVDSIVHLVHDPTLSPDAPYDVTSNKIDKYLVKPGENCVNKLEPLFKVIVIHIDDGTFAVVFSISHLIGDGFTFYELYGMLSESSEVRQLQSKRDFDFERKVDAKMNGNDTYSYILSLATTFNILKTLLWDPAPTMHVFRVSERWIADEKARYASSPAAHTESDDSTSVGNSTNSNSVTAPRFISTNDIITSWFFRFCCCDIGFMLINLRNRVEDVTEEHAGNYQSLIGYQKVDFTEPYLIRQSITGVMRRAVSGAYPSFLQASRARLNMLTSWVTFYKDVKLPGCVQTLHIPIGANKNVSMQDVGILFRPSANELAMIVFGRSFTASQLWLEDAVSRDEENGASKLPCTSPSSHPPDDIHRHEGGRRGHTGGGGLLLTAAALAATLSVGAALYYKINLRTVVSKIIP